MATDSLGEYKVVVTADYSQLQAQFQAMASYIANSTKTISDSMNNAMGGVNASMVSQLKTTVDELKRSFDGVEPATRKAGDGFKSYTKQIREAQAEAEKAHIQIQRIKADMEQGINPRTSNNISLQMMTQEFEKARTRVDSLKAAQQDFKNRIDATNLAAKELDKSLVQAGKDEQRLMRQNANLLQGELRARQQIDAQNNRSSARQAQQISRLQTQYRVAYEEINKYIQSNTKMSEAVFIRLQSRIEAIGARIRDLGATPAMANPLAGMDFEKYESGFSRLTDAVKALKHHMAWMASAAVIAGFIGLPTAISKATEAFDALNTKIMQNMELSSEYEGNTQKLHSDMGRMAKDAMVLSQGYGISVNEVQEAMQTLSRRFKDAGTAVYLTDIALKMSKLDMVDTKQSAKDLEAVMLQFGMGAKQAKDFLNDFSVICHTARISGTDMLMALERSGSAFKAMNMGAREAMAAIAAVSTVTGKTGATIGDSWKSILANMDFKKATAALEHYNIKLYETASNGARVMRSGSTVLSEILTVYKDLDDKQRRQLATAIAGGKYQVNNMLAFLNDASSSFLENINQMKQKSSDETTEALLQASMNTYQTNLNQAKAAFHNFAVVVGGMALPTLKNFALAMAGVGLFLQKHASTILGTAKAIGQVALAFVVARTAAMIFSKAVAAQKSLALIYKAIKLGIEGVTLATNTSRIATWLNTAAIAAYNIVSGIATAGSLAFSAGMAAGGIAGGIAAGGVGILVGAVTALDAVLSPIILTVLAVVAAIAALGVIAYAIYEQWSTVSEGLSSVWDGMVEVIATAVELIIVALTPFMVFIYAIAQVVIWFLSNVVAPVFNAIASVVGSVIQRVNSFLQAHGITVQSVGNFIRGLWSRLINFLAANISPAFASWLDGMVSKLGEFASSVLSIASRVKDAIRSMFGMASSAGEEGPGIIDSLANKAKSLLGTDLLNTVANAEADMQNSKYATMPDMPLGGGGGFGDMPSGGGGGGGRAGRGGSGNGGNEADNSIEAILYRFLTKSKGESHNRAIGELAAIQSTSGFNYQAGEGTDRRGLYGWNKEQWANYEKWLKGTGYSDSAVSQINYLHTYANRYDQNTKDSYQKFLQSNSLTGNDFAQAFSQYITKSGAIDQGIVNSFHERFAKKNGEENYDDPMKATEERYKLLKKEFDSDIADLKNERAKKGETVTPDEIKARYEKMMGITEGNNPFAYFEKAMSDYNKVILDSIKYEEKRQKGMDDAVKKQTESMTKMADAEVAFAEKLGIMDKKDVRNYNIQKNELAYARQNPMLEEMLRATSNAPDEMMKAYDELINAQNEADAKLYAKKLFELSKDVDATKKALDAKLKLDEQYEQKKYQLQQEEYQYKNRYAIKFVDSYVNAWQEGLEGILNRTKSFSDAMRDIFKSIVKSMIKMFSEDMGGKLRKLMSTALHNPKDNGNASGARAGHVDKALDKEKNKITDKAKDELKDSLISSKAVKTAKAQVKDLFSFKHKAAKESAQAVKATSTEELATTTANKTAEQAMHTQAETTETAVTVSQSTARTAATNQAHVNVMKNLGAMMAQMLAAMAVLAIFSSLFKGGSKTETSTSSVNLGRSPDSYYMTPTPVMQSTSFTVPSMDIGGNIEKDMLIFAHKNEMVLTPEQADVIRSTAKNGGSVGGSGSNASIKSNITVSTVDSRGFDRVLRNYNRDLSKQVKKGIRNGYLNANGLV